jgi:phosphohistidine phosphatase
VTSAVRAHQLVLIRHAKAADGDIDIKRALTARGRRDAAGIGLWLAARESRPDRVVVSPAVRAAQTWQYAAAALSSDGRPLTAPLIYANRLEALLEIIRSTPSEVRMLALVGHNPSIGMLAYALDDAPAAQDRFADGYPTSGCAIFTLAATFADVVLGSATLAADNVRPEGS